ncbi:MAG: hypothetical protein ABIJ56_14950 [Pseudomonadota bacterium]
MKSKIPKVLSALLMILCFAAFWQCGGGGGGDDDADVTTDGEDMDGVDGVTDADAPGDPTGEDPAAEVEPDADQDAEEDAPGDTVEEDGVEPAPVQPFLSETAGGASLSSANYKLELFVAPVRPVGSTSSASYNLKLGPAGVRSK